MPTLIAVSERVRISEGITPTPTIKSLLRALNSQLAILGSFRCLAVTRDAHCLRSQAPVFPIPDCDDALGELAVGYDDRDIRNHPDPGRASSDVSHVTLLARLQPDEITDAHRPLGKDVDPGEKVGENVAQGQGGGDAPDTQGSHQGSNSNTKGA